MSLIIFFLALYFFVYLPGKFLFKKTKIALDAIESAGMGLSIGLGIFTALSCLSFWLHFHALVLLLLLPVSIIQFITDIKEIKNLQFAHVDWLLISLVTLGSLVMSFYVFRSGTIQNGLYIFYGVNAVDGIYHVSLIQSLIAQFPPQHLSLPGQDIRGYNFLYDLLVGSFVTNFHLNILDVFFRYIPIVVAILFGVTGYIFSTKLGISRKASLVAVVGLYLLRGLDWYANVIFLHMLHLPFTSSGIMQSPEQLLDASVAFSLTLFFTAGSLVLSKKSVWNTLLIVLIVSLIPTVKIYTGLIFFIGFGVYSLYILLKKKDWSYMALFIISALLALLMYLPLNFGAGKLIVAPFLLFRFYIENAALFQYLHWNVTLRLFEDKHNFLHLGFMYVVVGILFLGSAFGLKLLGLLIAYKKKIWTPAFLFITSAILAGTIIPLIFIQTVAPLVIIQFFWIVNILLVFLFALFLDSVITQKKSILWIIVGICVVCFSLPDLIFSLSGFVSPQYVTSADTIQTVLLLDQVPNDKTTLVLGKKDGVNVPILSALTGHKVYFENEVMEFSNTRQEAKKRSDNISQLSDEIRECNNASLIRDNVISLLRTQHISYLIAPTEDTTCLSKIGEMRQEKNVTDWNLYILR